MPSEDQIRRLKPLFSQVSPRYKYCNQQAPLSASTSFTTLWLAGSTLVLFFLWFFLVCFFINKYICWNFTEINNSMHFYFPLLPPSCFQIQFVAGSAAARCAESLEVDVICQLILLLAERRKLFLFRCCCPKGSKEEAKRREGQQRDLAACVLIYWQNRMEQKRRKWNRNVNTMVISCFNFLLHKYCHCFHFPVNIIFLLLHYHCFHNYGNVPSGAVILLFYSIVFYWLWPTGPIRCPDCLLQTSRRIKKLLLCNSMKSGAIGARQPIG